MKIKKTLVGVLCIISILIGAFTAYAAGASFTDVESGKWYTEHINYAVENGIFKGTSATTFSPNTNMTRAQFVQVFANISNVDTSNKNVSSSFSDVPSGKWYSAAVKWAAENGVVNGIGNGKFAPEDPVTREQMCVMLVNYVEKFQKETLETTVDTKTFDDDSKIASWAKDSVYKCAKAGLVNGVGNNMFDPQGTTTRAQGATFFSNFYKYENHPETWFDKQGFKITSWTPELCKTLCESHECQGPKFSISETTDHWAVNDEEKAIVLSYSLYCFENCNGGFLPIDRNTGTILKFDDIVLNIDGEEISLKEMNGHSGYYYNDVVICPIDFDGVVFLYSENYDFSKYDSSRLNKVEEVVDFSKGNYYFFSYNNK